MRKKLIKGITAIAVVMLAIAVACADSDTWIPLFVILVTGAWLALVLVANRDLLEKKYYD